MTPEQCARAVAGPIGKFGGTWMMAPATFGPAIEAGFAGLDFYFRGRGGVRGEVDASVVVAAMGLLGPDVSATCWNDGRSVMSAADAASKFANACADFGRANLPNGVDYDELVILSRTVIDAAECAGLPLFAGWRAMPVPSDARGAAAHELNVLRELRGGAHVVAVIAHGLTPLEATLASSAPIFWGSAPPVKGLIIQAVVP